MPANGIFSSPCDGVNWDSSRHCWVAQPILGASAADGSAQPPELFPPALLGMEGAKNEAIKRRKEMEDAALSQGLSPSGPSQTWAAAPSREVPLEGLEPPAAVAGRGGARSSSGCSLGRVASRNGAAGGSAALPVGGGRPPGQALGSQPMAPAASPASVRQTAMLSGASAAGPSAPARRNMAATSSGSTGQPHRVPQRSQPRSPSQPKREKREPTVGTPAGSGALGSRSSVRAVGSTSTLQRRAGPQSREASPAPTREASPAKSMSPRATSRDLRTRPRSPVSRQVEQRSVKPKDLLPDRSRRDTFLERRPGAGDLRPQSAAQKVDIERRRVQQAKRADEARRGDDLQVGSLQVAELQRRLDRMQEEADRRDQQFEAMMQENQQLHRQLSEMRMRGAASDATNGDRQTLRSSTVPSSPESPCNGASARSDRNSVDVPTAPRPPKSLSLQFVEQGTIGQLVKPEPPQEDSLSSSKGVLAVASVPAPPAEATNGHTVAATTRSGSAVVPSTGTSPRSPRDSSLPGPRLGASGRRSAQVHAGEPVRRTWPTAAGITTGPAMGINVIAGTAIGIGIAAAPSAGLSPGVSSPGIRSVAATGPRPVGSPGAAGPVCAMTPQSRR